MNKQAYLENVYNSSFNDELEKIAIGLRDLKKIQKNIIKPMLIRKRSLDIDWKGGFASPKLHISSNRKGVAVHGIGKESVAKEMGRLQGLGALGLSKNMHKKIFTGKGGVNKVFNTMSKPFEDFGIKIQMPKHKSQKEILGRVGLMHEFSETKMKKAIPFAGHTNPKVFMEESNLVSSLPKRYSPAKKYLSKIRSFVETPSIDKFYPGFKYGKTRLSRAGKKHIERRNKQFSQELMEGLKK